MILIIVMGGNVIVFFHGGVSLLTGIAQYYVCNLLPLLHECAFTVCQYVCNYCLPDTGLHYTRYKERTRPKFKYRQTLETNPAIQTLETVRVKQSYPKPNP